MGKIIQMFEEMFPDLELTSSGGATLTHVIRSYGLSNNDILDSFTILKRKEKELETEEDMFKYLLGILHNKGRSKEPYVRERKIKDD